MAAGVGELRPVFSSRQVSNIDDFGCENNRCMYAYNYYASVRACAQRHTVVCLCVCLSVCSCITAITAQRLKYKCK